MLHLAVLEVSVCKLRCGFISTTQYQVQTTTSFLSLLLTVEPLEVMPVGKKSTPTPAICSPLTWQAVSKVLSPNITLLDDTICVYYSLTTVMFIEVPCLDFVSKLKQSTIRL